MIGHMVVLVVASVMMPYVPVSPLLAVTLPVGRALLKEQSLLSELGLPRLFSAEQLKSSFKEAARKYHPDRGGDPEVFTRLRTAKQILEKHPEFYDRFNITDAGKIDNPEGADDPLLHLSETKQAAYTIEAVMFYLLLLLYALVFTIDPDLVRSRFLLLPALLGGAAAEYVLMRDRSIATPLDAYWPYVPLFQQLDYWKDILAVGLVAAIQRFQRKPTEEALLLRQFEKPGLPLATYRDLLQRLLQLQVERRVKRQQSEQSLWSKAKNFIVKGFLAFALFQVIYNVALK